MQPSNISNDWWPEFLQEIAAEDPLVSENVVVAEIGHPWGPKSYRHLYTALVKPDKAHAILTYPGGIGNEVDASGPHPSFSPTEPYEGYEPKFWIWAGQVVADGLEPLIVSWTSASQTILCPDQGLLMTYGLVPRQFRHNDIFEIHWDDPSVPRHDVVIVRPVSSYGFPKATHAFVTVQRDYLRDYATLRGCSLVQVYYADKWCPPTNEIRSILGNQTFHEFSLPGRLVELRVLPQVGPEVLAKIWGVRALVDPGESPISGGRWEYGSLNWPGFGEPISRVKAMRIGLKMAFVTDTVLAEYEGRKEFQIYPESGAVSYGHQWSVSYTRRVGRDLIALELKKLYEGTPPEVVRHWHRHAVDCSVENLVTLEAEPNVATRARRITYGLLNLGDIVAKIASMLLEDALNPSDIVGLERQDLDYRGWWKGPNIEPITRHIPLNITEDDFLSRCNEIHKLVIEGLNEKILRRTLIRLSASKEDIKGLKSLKLLDILLQSAVVATQSGLDLLSNGKEVAPRRKAEKPSTPAKILFVLKDLRIAGSHRGVGSRAKSIDVALDALGLHRDYLATGRGIALDFLYDVIGEALEQSSSILLEATKHES